jgi:hypothetical protein
MVELDSALYWVIFFSIFPMILIPKKEILEYSSHHSLRS